MGTADDKQVCLVAYKLKGGESAWWDCIQLNHTCEGKLLIRSWRRMKRLMADQFFPPNYQGVVQTVLELQAGYLDS